MADPIQGLCRVLQKAVDITDKSWIEQTELMNDECEEKLQKLRDLMISHGSRSTEEELKHRLKKTSKNNIEVSQSLLACAFASADSHVCFLACCSTCVS